MSCCTAQMFSKNGPVAKPKNEAGQSSFGQVTGPIKKKKRSRKDRRMKKFIIAEFVAKLKYRQRQRVDDTGVNDSSAEKKNNEWFAVRRLLRVRISRNNYEFLVSYKNSTARKNLWVRGDLIRNMDEEKNSLVEALKKKSAKGGTRAARGKRKPTPPNDYTQKCPICSVRLNRIRMQSHMINHPDTSTSTST